MAICPIPLAQASKLVLSYYGSVYTLRTSRPGIWMQYNIPSNKSKVLWVIILVHSFETAWWCRFIDRWRSVLSRWDFINMFDWPLRLVFLLPFIDIECDLIFFDFSSHLLFIFFNIKQWTQSSPPSKLYATPCKWWLSTYNCPIGLTGFTVCQTQVPYNIYIYI